VGKTTVLTKTADALNAEGYTVGGMISCEVREGGTRVGFEIRALHSGRCGWLAHANQKSGPQVGRYRVNIGDLNSIGTQAIVAAMENCDVIAIDEIGPMELFSEQFIEATRKALESGKMVFAVVHCKAQDRLIVEARNRPDAELVTVTSENREKLHETIVERVLMTLKRAKM
jgi:nucleoside-triphosphatase